MSTLAEAEFLARLERDASTVLGLGAGPRLAYYIGVFRGLDRADFEEFMAESIQQEVLDTHVHTAWPPCPAHRVHPLWYSSGAWRCALDTTVSVELGGVHATHG